MSAYGYIGSTCPALAGFGSFGAATEPIEHWGGRIAFANSAITAAMRVAPEAVGQLAAAQALVYKAKSVHDFQKKEGIWTEQGEEAVSENLEAAKGAFDAAQATAIAAGRGIFPVAWPTWRGATLGVPQGGVVPPASEGGPGAADQGGGTNTVVVKQGLGLVGVLAIALGVGMLVSGRRR